MPLKKGIPEAPVKIYAEQLYKMEEVAGVLRCDLHTIYNYRLQGRIKTIKLGLRVYRVSGAEILYIKKNGLRPVMEKYRKEAAAIQRIQRAKRKAKAAKAEAGILPNGKLAKVKDPHTRTHTRTRARKHG